jgi:hypothetical protein
MQEPPGTCSRNSNMVNPAALPAHPLSERSLPVFPFSNHQRNTLRELQVMVQVRSLRERFFEGVTPVHSSGGESFSICFIRR